MNVHSLPAPPEGWQSANSLAVSRSCPPTRLGHSVLADRRGDRLLGVRCKRADAPGLTKSIRIALDDLGLERVAIVYPGAKRYPLGEMVEALPISTLAEPGTLFAEKASP